MPGPGRFNSQILDQTQGDDNEKEYPPEAHLHLLGEHLGGLGGEDIALGGLGLGG